MRCSDDLTESGGGVLQTGAWRPRYPDLYPTSSVYGTDGDYGYGYNGGPGDDGALDGFCSDDEPYAYCPEGDTGTTGARGQPTKAASATRGQPEGRGGPTPCWNEQCERKHDAQRKYSLCNWCGVFEFGSKPGLLCKMVSAPHSLRCDNWSRGCPGGASGFGPVLTDNLTPGSPAFVLGQRISAISRESKQLRTDRDRAARAARAD